jgi:hypothetical protein
VRDPQTGHLIGIGRKIGRLFEIYFLQIPSHLSISVTAFTTSSSLWDSCLGNASLPRVHLLASQGHLGSVDLKHFHFVSCPLGNQTHLSFNKSESFSSPPFDLINFDIWGPSRFPLREDLAFLLSLLMIILVILGYIFYNIDLNLLIFIKIFTKW